MNRTPIFSAVLVLASIALSSTAVAAESAAAHPTRILERFDHSARIDAGSADGVTVGDALTIVGHVRIERGGGKAPPTIERQIVGHVRVARVTGEHSAEVTLVQGAARAGDEVRR